MIKKYNKNLNKITVNNLKEIYQITLSNLNEIGKLKEFSISDYTIENLVFPFLFLVQNKEIRFNFDSFAFFANKKFSELSNII